MVAGHQVARAVVAVSIPADDVLGDRVLHIVERPVLRVDVGEARRAGEVGHVLVASRQGAGDVDGHLVAGDRFRGPVASVRIAANDTGLGTGHDRVVGPVGIQSIGSRAPGGYVGEPRLADAIEGHWGQRVGLGADDVVDRIAGGGDVFPDLQVLVVVQNGEVVLRRPGRHPLVGVRHADRDRPGDLGGGVELVELIVELKAGRHLGRIVVTHDGGHALIGHLGERHRDVVHRHLGV